MHEAYMSKYSLSLFREEEKPIFSGKSLRIREAYLIGKKNDDNSRQNRAKIMVYTEV